MTYFQVVFKVVNVWILLVDSLHEQLEGFLLHSFLLLSRHSRRRNRSLWKVDGFRFQVFGKNAPRLQIAVSAARTMRENGRYFVSFGQIERFGGF